MYIRFRISYNMIDKVDCLTTEVSKTRTNLLKILLSWNSVVWIFASISTKPIHFISHWHQLSANWLLSALIKIRSFPAPKKLAIMLYWVATSGEARPSDQIINPVSFSWLVSTKFCASSPDGSLRADTPCRWFRVDCTCTCNVHVHHLQSSLFLASVLTLTTDRFVLL